MIDRDPILDQDPIQDQEANLETEIIEEDQEDRDLDLNWKIKIFNSTQFWIYEIFYLIN